MLTEVEHQGYTIEVDGDPDCPDPRDWDGSFLWIGFPHRNYRFGDEQIDPIEDVEIPCADCAGAGTVDERHPGMCETCAGYGHRQPATLLEACEQIAKDRDALHWEMVSMAEHSMCHYHIGSPNDRWDSGVTGIMLVTREMADEWGCNPENDPAEWRRQMVGEVDLYDRWQSGEGCSYTVRDRDGKIVDQCGGYIGEGEALEQAKACIGDEVAPRKTPPALVVSTRYVWQWEHNGNWYDECEFRTQAEALERPRVADVRLIRRTVTEQELIP